MEKSPDAFRTISEVAEHLETPAHVLRFWESRFPQIRPVKRAGGRRYYRPADVALLAGIKRLLHDEGLTIRGVQKMLREQGVRHVAGLGSGGALFEEEADLEAQIAAEFGPAAESDVPPAEAESATIVALETALMRARARDGAAAPAPDEAIMASADEAMADGPGLDVAAMVDETAGQAGPDPWAVPGAETETAAGPDMAASSPTQPDLWDAIAAREAEATPRAGSAPVAAESQAGAEALPIAQRIRALPHGARLARQVELRALRDRLQSLRDRLSGPVRGVAR